MGILKPKEEGNCLRPPYKVRCLALRLFQTYQKRQGTLLLGRIGAGRVLKQP